ncbi:S8 family serine peptidase [Pseudokineococcus sp. 1T1Z-3]|uniref:S8 family serine peptidase n=1 Tax=Pseudokineococcus sp. 1T1Z-3 TaxID=3132745 RepID=UPI0030B0FACD
MTADKHLVNLLRRPGRALPGVSACCAVLLVGAFASPTSSPPELPGWTSELAPEVLAELRPLAGEAALDADVPGPTTEVALAVAEGAGLEISTVEVPRSRADAVVDLLDTLPAVEASSVPSTMRTLRGGAVPARSPDPLRPQQWGLDALAAESFRLRANGTPVVAVVDSGVAAYHQDLRTVVLPGADMTSSGGDGRRDSNGHGTHVAGIAGAAIANGLGGEGLARLRVLPVKALGADGTGSTTAIARGVVWAADNGADVVNLSLGGPVRDDVLERAIAYAVSQDVVVVAAMGNEGSGSPTYYPAAYPDVLAVAAVGKDLRRAPYSSTGAHADLAAPGTAIVSTVVGDGDDYGAKSGTSMAAPYVAAAAAVLVSTVPGASARQVADALTSTARDLGAVGRDAETGYGLVDPAAALTALEEATGRAPRTCR